MHSKSDNKEIVVNDEVDEVIKKLFKSLLNMCQIGLEKSMDVSDFVFHYVH